MGHNGTKGGLAPSQTSFITSKWIVSNDMFLIMQPRIFPRITYAFRGITKHDIESVKRSCWA